MQVIASGPNPKSFKGKEAEKIYQGRYSKRIPKDIQRLAAYKEES